MLVIMDMVWLEWCCRSNPTQISALRVTEGWEEECRFDRIIRPDSEQNTAWDHMALPDMGRMISYPRRMPFPCLVTCRPG